MSRSPGSAGDLKPDHDAADELSMMGLLPMAAPPTRRLAAMIRFDDGWWSVSVPELPGVFTHVVDRAGAEEAIREAIAFAADLDPSSFDIELVDA